jgi:hypothetical protein
MPSPVRDICIRPRGWYVLICNVNYHAGDAHAQRFTDGLRHHDGGRVNTQQVFQPIHRTADDGAEGVTVFCAMLLTPLMTVLFSAKPFTLLPRMAKFWKSLKKKSGN